MRTALLLASLVLIAGCSDPAPSGEFTTDRNTVAAEGTVEMAFQERQMPYPNPALCPPEDQNVPQNLRCIPASTTVSGHMMTLHDASPEGYALYWTNATGEMKIVDLVKNETGDAMWDIPRTTFDADQSGFETVELRMGDLVVATASNGEGPNSFTVNPDLTGMSATGVYKGRDLTVTVTGAPENVTFTGFLYEDADGNVTQAQGMNFVIGGDGEWEFRADRDIAEFAEFHIHIAGSKINVAQADI